MSNTALFACSKCLTRHPFEELSSGQQLCKDCRGSVPVVKCTYCRSEFQQANKLSSICPKCENNVKQFGKPTACEYCNIIAAFIGNKCQRCTNSERKYGAPVTCEQCKQKCAFDRKDDDKKVDGKLLCWLCTLSYKRALAKTKQSDAERRAAHMKLAAQRNKMKDGRDARIRSHKRSSSSRAEGNKDIAREPGADGPPPAKAPRHHGAHQPHGNHRPPGETLDPNSSDHVVAMTQLKEQMASLQKQLVQKDAMLLSKDKMITELKAKHFTIETELRNKMKNEQNENDKKFEILSGKLKSLRKEVFQLKKSSGKKSIGSANTSVNAGSGAGSGGSGTDSPLP